jgi:hypothetical protein
LTYFAAAVTGPGKARVVIREVIVRKHRTCREKSFLFAGRSGMTSTG